MVKEVSLLKESDSPSTLFKRGDEAPRTPRNIEMLHKNIKDVKNQVEMARKETLKLAKTLGKLQKPIETSLFEIE